MARGRAGYDSDEDLQLALVRLVEIVGEAARHVSAALVAAHPDIPWREAIAMRNRVVHGYFDVDHDILWSVVAVDIPSFATQLDAVLDELPAVES